MNRMATMLTTKERYRPMTIRKFPDSIRQRVLNIKAALDNKKYMEDIYIAALEEGLTVIEKRVYFKIPDFIEEPEEDE